MNRAACPNSNGKKNQCPFYIEHHGVCFTRCDMSSDKLCGECAHWVGDCTVGEERHKRFGHCLYYIGGVLSCLPTDCEHWVQRKEGEPNWIDWVESRVVELGGESNSEPKNRELRKKALSEWKITHMRPLKIEIISRTVKNRNV